MTAASHPLRELLLENKALRAAGNDASVVTRLAELQLWQRERLTRTYADFGMDSRYGPALEFFLADLYGPRDLAARDADLLRVQGVMERVLPARAREAMTLAVELEVLSQRLDLAMVRKLAAGPVTELTYAEAYRAATEPEQRERQIELVERAGRSLNDLVRRPLIPSLVRLAHGPAHAAGFGALQDFIERGFAAFSAIGDAEPFLGAIGRRERVIMQRLFAADPAPFDWQHA